MDPDTKAEGGAGLRNLLQLKKVHDPPTPGELPPAYKANSHRERLYVWAADNFRRQVRARHPALEPACLVAKNECGTEKVIITFIKVWEFAPNYN